MENEQAVQNRDILSGRETVQQSVPPAQPTQDQTAPLPSWPSPTSTSRPDQWHLLRQILNGQTANAKRATARAQQEQAASLMVFSMTGGTGKTTLAATLGRALATFGDRILLVDMATPYGMLPLYFGSDDMRSGIVRRFVQRHMGDEQDIELLTLDPQEEEPANGELSTRLLSAAIQGKDRIVYDLSLMAGPVLQQTLRTNPVILVPLIADMASVIMLDKTEALFSASPFGANEPYYVLNQFDESSNLQQKIRDVMNARLKNRLLSVAIRKDAAIQEALAEGMTVIDYNRRSSIVSDFQNIAEWLRSVSSPAAHTSLRGQRWTEI